MAKFKNFIEDLIEKEGGYKLIDVKHDRGGQTYAGISRKFNPNWIGWKAVDAGEKPLKADVHNFYKSAYWDAVLLDHINDDEVAEILFSSAVLSGTRVAARLAQASAKVGVDGHIGPKSLAAINGMNPEVFALRFALARIARFSGIVQRDRTQSKFFRGWVNRVIEEI